MRLPLQLPQQLPLRHLRYPLDRTQDRLLLPQAYPQHPELPMLDFPRRPDFLLPRVLLTQAFLLLPDFLLPRVLLTQAFLQLPDFLLLRARQTRAFLRLPALPMLDFLQLPASLRCVPPGTACSTSCSRMMSAFCRRISAMVISRFTGARSG